MACVYCGLKFDPEIICGHRSRAICPYCGKANSVITWDEGGQECYKLGHWNRPKGYSPKQLITLRLDADVIEAMRKVEDYNARAGEVLRREFCD